MRIIEKIEVFPVRLPITGTFRFASGTTGEEGDTAPHVFVKITDNLGESGWGEGRPLPQWSYETLETAVTTINRYLAPTLLKMPVTDRWELHKRMHRAIGRGPSTGQPVAKGAVDMALHDLCARVAGMSLRSYLGGSSLRSEVSLSYTLTGGDSASVEEEIEQARGAGFCHFNFKVAVTPGTDLEVAAAARRAAGPKAFVWADANQGYQLHQARSVASSFAELGINVLEQPFPSDRIGLMRQLRNECRLPLAVDEASVSPADFFQYASEGLVDFLVVKVNRVGGIGPTIAQLHIAEAAGLPFLVSGLTEGLLAKVAACQVALAYGFEGPAALNGSQFIDESALYPEKSEIEFGGAVHLTDEAGIGVRPDKDGIDRFLAEELMP